MFKTPDTSTPLERILVKTQVIEQQQNHLLRGLVDLYNQGYTKAEIERALRYIEAREIVRQQFGL